MDDLGIKRLTVEIWLEPDSAMAFYVTVAEGGILKPQDGSVWLSQILKVELSSIVPLDVRKLFEVARGTLAYGYFYYKHYTLALEQLFRVTDAAIIHKCESLGVRKPKQTYSDRLKILVSKNIISKEAQADWEHIIDGRNFSSHPEQQMILTPAMAIKRFAELTDHINALFLA